MGTHGRPAGMLSHNCVKHLRDSRTYLGFRGLTPVFKPYRNTQLQGHHRLVHIEPAASACTAFLTWPIDCAPHATSSRIGCTCTGHHMHACGLACMHMYTATLVHLLDGINPCMQSSRLHALGHYLVPLQWPQPRDGFKRCRGRRNGALSSKQPAGGGPIRLRHISTGTCLSSGSHTEQGLPHFALSAIARRPAFFC